MRAKVKKFLAQRIGAPDILNSLQLLSRNGFKPKQIFDVGAYQGDFARLCFDVWPEAKVVAFEVLDHKVERLRKMAEFGNSVEVVTCLLGAHDRDSVPFHEMETASSVLEEHIQQSAPVKSHPMRTVDRVVRDRGASPPDFLKLDVQGYELEVLKGAEESLNSLQVILAELNFLDIHKNVPLVSEVIAWLDERGWVAYDVCGLTRRPLDGALWQADLIFVPKDSPLRTNKAWA
ncbi:MAG TPA: FkbM family methyltransferase [Pyrinomonadaceae bacterium]